MAKKDNAFDKLRDAGKLDQYNEIVGNLGQTSNNRPARQGGNGVPAATFEGKTAPVADVIHWVAENLVVNDVEASDAPSASAWAMLTWAQSDATNRAEFWRNVYTKLLPSRAQLEAIERFHDDGRELNELEDELLRMAREASLAEPAETLTEADA